MWCRKILCHIVKYNLLSYLSGKSDNSIGYSVGNKWCTPSSTATDKSMVSWDLWDLGWMKPQFNAHLWERFKFFCFSLPSTWSVISFLYPFTFHILSSQFSQNCIQLPAFLNIGDYVNVLYQILFLLLINFHNFKYVKNIFWYSLANFVIITQDLHTHL